MALLSHLFHLFLLLNQLVQLNDDQLITKFVFPQQSRSTLGDSPEDLNRDFTSPIQTLHQQLMEAPVGRAENLKKEILKCLFISFFKCCSWNSFFFAQHPTLKFNFPFPGTEWLNIPFNGRDVANRNKSPIEHTKIKVSKPNLRQRFRRSFTNEPDHIYTADNNTERTSGGTFANCKFDHCSDWLGAGALELDNTSLSLVVDNCTFDTCSSTGRNGGAIFCFNCSTLIVRNSCYFTGCSAEYGGGAIYTDTISTCFFVHSAEFCGCYADYRNAGGGMTLLHSPNTTISSTCSADAVKDQLGDAVLRDLNLSSCEANGTTDSIGGGIALYYPQQGYSVRNCQITSCKSTYSQSNGYGGGGVYISIGSDFQQATAFLFYVYFHNNSAAAYGADLCLWGRPFSDSNETSPLGIGCTTSEYKTSKPFSCTYRTTNCNGWIAEGQRIPEPKVYVHPDSLNSDPTACGLAKEQASETCKNIEIALQTASAKAGTAIIMLGGIHTHEESQMTFNDSFTKQVVIKGEATEANETITIQISPSFSPPPWIKVESSNTPGLSIQSLNISFAQPGAATSTQGNEANEASFDSLLFEIGGKLELQSVIFSTKKKDDSCSHSLIKLTCGSLSLSTVKFEDFTLRDSPLIAWTGGVISNNDATTFSSVTRQDGSGVVFDIKSNSDESFTITNINCSGCVCAEGDGGAISGVLNGGTINIGENTTTTSFSSCTAPNGRGGGIFLNVGSSLSYKLENVQFGEGNDAVYGKNLFILSTSPSESIKKENLDVRPVINEETKEHYTYSDGSGNSSTNSLPLFSLLPPSDSSSSSLFLSSLSVSSSAADDAHCGSRDKPCLSLSRDQTRIEPSSSSSSSSSSSLSSLFVVEEARTGSGAVTLKRVALKPYDPSSSLSSATLDVKGSDEKEGKEEDSPSPSSLITTEENVTIERIIFSFDSSFSSSFSHFLSSSSGSLSLSRCSFACMAVSLSSFWSSSSGEKGSVVWGKEGTEVNMTKCFFTANSGEGERQRERRNEGGGGEEEKEGREGRENEGEEVASVCSWSSSLLHFSGCTATLTRVNIRGSEKGALSLEDDAKVEIIEGDFAENS